MTETRVGDQILPQRLDGRAHELLIFLLDATHHAALAAELRAVGDVQMPDETRLSTHHAVLAEMR